MNDNRTFMNEIQRDAPEAMARLRGIIRLQGLGGMLGIDDDEELLDLEAAEMDREDRRSMSAMSLVEESQLLAAGMGDTELL